MRKTIEEVVFLWIANYVLERQRSGERPYGSTIQPALLLA